MITVLPFDKVTYYDDYLYGFIIWKKTVENVDFDTLTVNSDMFFFIFLRFDSIKLIVTML